MSLKQIELVDEETYVPLPSTPFKILGFGGIEKTNFQSLLRFDKDTGVYDKLWGRYQIENIINVYPAAWLSGENFYVCATLKEGSQTVEKLYKLTSDFTELWSVYLWKVVKPSSRQIYVDIRRNWIIVVGTSNLAYDDVFTFVNMFILNATTGEVIYRNSSDSDDLSDLVGIVRASDGTYYIAGSRSTAQFGSVSTASVWKLQYVLGKFSCIWSWDSGGDIYTMDWSDIAAQGIIVGGDHSLTWEGSTGDGANVWILSKNGIVTHHLFLGGVFYTITKVKWYGTTHYLVAYAFHQDLLHDCRIEKHKLVDDSLVWYYTVANGSKYSDYIKDILVDPTTGEIYLGCSTVYVE